MDIQIVEKPESISFEEIHQLLSAAHSVNQDKGFHLKTAELSGEEIRKRIGRNGKCWVALEQGRPVGTLSVRIVKRNLWYAKGMVPNYMLAAVMPEYMGQHILTKLSDAAFCYVQDQGYSGMELDTAEDNTHAIEVYKHLGFRPVGYRRKTGVDHYSVVMYRWFGQCPFPNSYIQLRYQLARIKRRVFNMR